MIPLIRVGYPSGNAEVTVKPDGTAKVSGFVVDIHEKFVDLLHVPNVTHVTSASSLDECYERMVANQTDVILTRRPPTDDEDAIYYIAVQTSLFVNQIVSAYDYSEYSRQVENVEESLTALISNFALFDGPTVFLVGTFLILFFSIFVLMVLLKVKRRTSNRREDTKTIIKMKRKERCERIKRQRRRQPPVTYRMIQLVFLVGFFFISCPFLAMFQTNKVVTQAPHVITTYEQVIERGAKIIFNREISDESLFKPNAESIARDDITARLYRYMMKNLFPFQIPSSPEGASQFDTTVNLITAGKVVFFAANHISDGFRDAVCSWSNENHLIQTHLGTDPSSRELFTGYPMRKGFSNEELFLKLRREFEAHLQKAMIDTSPQYAGIDFKKDFTTPDHRRQQLVLCMTSHLLREQKEPQPTGIRPFALIMAIYIAINTTILTLHLIGIITRKCNGKK